MLVSLPKLLPGIAPYSSHKSQWRYHLTQEATPNHSPPPFGLNQTTLDSRIRTPSQTPYILLTHHLSLSDCFIITKLLYIYGQQARLLRSCPHHTVFLSFSSQLSAQKHEVFVNYLCVGWLAGWVKDRALEGEATEQCHSKLPLWNSLHLSRSPQHTLLRATETW